MAYKKVSRKPKTTWYNKKHSISIQGVAKKLYNLQSMINSEVMKLDTTSTGGAQQTITHLTAISQDDTVSGRTGNSILLKNISIKGSLQINSAVSISSRYTVALLQDTQQVGDGLPSNADIWKSNTEPQTLLLQSAVGRFKVIKRWNGYLGTAQGGQTVKLFDYFHKFPLNTHVRYNGTANSDIQKNGLYLSIITSEAVNFPTTGITTRLGYHDN